MRFLLLALLLLPALSACETWNRWTDSVTGSSADEDTKKPEEATCLPVLAPTETATSNISAGDGPMDVNGTATVAVGDVTCKATDTGMRQTVVLKLNATKGPALKDGKLPTPFFAAVVDADGNVAAKKLYRTTFDFGSELKADEEVMLVFKLTPEQSKSGNIYVGLSDAVPSKL